MTINEAGVSSTESEEQLRESLKRCSPQTIAAAIEYRRTGRGEFLAPIVLGIIERFVEPEFRSKIQEGDDEVRVVEDLGVDSLMMLEIVMLVEDTLDVSIENDELMELRTLGDVKTLIECKVRGVPLPLRPVRMDLEEIAATVPFRRPFLFLDEAVLRDGVAQGSYRIDGGEAFLEGHFKDNPIFPASIMIEALGQLAVLYLIRSSSSQASREVDPDRILFAACDGVRCTRLCRPGDVLDLKVKLQRMRKPLAVFEGDITSEGRKVASIQELSLTFDYRGSPSLNNP